MDFQDKRRQREEKRQVKKAGSRHRRRAWKQAVGDNPETAADIPDDLGGHVSATFNGNDRDATRRTQGGQDPAVGPAQEKGSGTFLLE